MDTATPADPDCPHCEGSGQATRETKYTYRALGLLAKEILDLPEPKTVTRTIQCPCTYDDEE